MHGKYIFVPSTEQIKQFSKDKSNKQLVRDAVLFRSRETLSIHHFFRAMGFWNNFYTLVIVLNGAISTLGYMQLMVLTFVVQEKDVYGNEDVYGNVTNIMENTITFRDNWGNNGKNDMTESFVLLMVAGGATFGYLILMWCYKIDVRRLILVSCILYAACVNQFVNKILPLTKASMFFCCACAEICRKSSIMHCMESLPKNLRPFGFCLMSLMNELGYILLITALRACSDWNKVAASFGIIYCVIGVIYFLLAPPSIQRSLVNCDKNILVTILSYWAENRVDGFNVEWLIDDVVFKKTRLVSTSHWEKIFFVLSRKHFTRKIIMLQLFILLGSIVLLHTSYSFAEKNTNLGVFEVELWTCSSHLVASIFMCLMIYWVGRRFCLFFTVWLFVVVHFIGLMIDFTVLDVCSRQEVPEGYDLVIGWIVSFLLSFSGTVIWLLAQFMMIEHIPSTGRSIILPIAHLFTNIAGALLTQVHMYFKDSLDTLLPNGLLLPTLIFGFLCSPLAVLIDNSSLMPVTAADVPCYYRPHTRFREETNVKFDDEKEDIQ